MWVDYLFFIDADNIILHKELFTTLIKRNKLIVGPMLETGVAWSNYWSDQVKKKHLKFYQIYQRSTFRILYIQNIETGYYERGDDYYDIRDYKNTSVHQVCYMT